ncbi:hypothetical protein JTB14_024306 [Gonioctena quinquepunctata]|nr:hypothetical protein JTB14_024306 [Gonioctena quinquepunctata]
MGDFNSYNKMWGSHKLVAGGRIIERLVDDRDLVVINNGQAREAIQYSRDSRGDGKDPWSNGGIARIIREKKGAFNISKKNPTLETMINLKKLLAKVGKITIVTAIMSNRLRSQNVADLARTFEKMKVETNSKPTPTGRTNEEGGRRDGQQRQLRPPNYPPPLGLKKGSVGQTLDDWTGMAIGHANGRKLAPNTVRLDTAVEGANVDPTVEVLEQKREVACSQPGGGDGHRICFQYQASRRALFFDAIKALISWDPLSFAVDPSTKGPQDQPMETTVSVEDESTPAEGVGRQLSAEMFHTAEGVSEMDVLLDPEDVTLRRKRPRQSPNS